VSTASATSGPWARRAAISVDDGSLWARLNPSPAAGLDALRDPVVDRPSDALAVKPGNGIWCLLMMMV
jgi:hypothetical protein